MDESSNFGGRTVTLVSVDAQTFVVPVKAAFLSKMIRRTLGGDDDDGEDEDAIVLPEVIEPVDLVRVRSGALQRIVDFMIHFQTEPLKEIQSPLGTTTFDEASISLSFLLVLVECPAYLSIPHSNQFDLETVGGPTMVQRLCLCQEHAGQRDV
jgi:hypothetical protein